MVSQGQETLKFNRISRPHRGLLPQRPVGRKRRTAGIAGGWFTGGYEWEQVYWLRAQCGEADCVGDIMCVKRAWPRRRRGWRGRCAAGPQQSSAPPPRLPAKLVKYRLKQSEMGQMRVKING